MDLFYAPLIQQEKALPLEEAQHCLRVLRKEEGDEILITDGGGAFYEAVIQTAHPKHCAVEITKTMRPEPLWPMQIVIAVAPTKNMDRMEWFTEKSTEIGINKIVPIACRYSERKVLKEERLTKVAIAAMKQSLKPQLPEITPMIPFEQLITQPFEGQKFIAHCYKNEKKELKKCYKKGENVLILIGPEGDFSEKEIEMALEKGFIPVSLGESRLRTETAALVACHTIHVVESL